jgi:hypothetical protein
LAKKQGIYCLEEGNKNKKLGDIVLTLKMQFDKNQMPSSKANVLVSEDRLSVKLHSQTFRPAAGAALPTEFLERTQFL